MKVTLPAASEKKEEEKKTEEMTETNFAASLQQLRSGIDRRLVRVHPVNYHMGRTMRRQFSNWSVLLPGLKDLQAVDWQSVVQAAASEDVSVDRALGCFLGMVAGDSVGAPLEFTPATGKPVKQRGRDESYVKFDADAFHYHKEENAFGLERGQWTDDASMGLCLAESMLARGVYHGGDARVRFHMWWFFGYCNAFRHDSHQRSSVGLGGNIGQSLQDLVLRYTNRFAEHVPGRYEATGEDAGNGSLMRLAPVPIRYHADVELAMNTAEESSYATHPGPGAAHCCRFVAFFICKALERPQDDTTDIATFTDSVIKEFLAGCDGNRSLGSLLQSKPPSRKEACWNWKADRLLIEETLANRGSFYNGYPVSAEYFGSYCMDGLAMALWALVHSESMTDCILKTVNLRGDADTTGSIAGQLAGAFYGYSSFCQDSCGKKILKDIRQWDPLYELELRALLLHQDGANGAKEAARSLSANAKGTTPQSAAMAPKPSCAEDPSNMRGKY